jgi:hypothetical protein
MNMIPPPRKSQEKLSDGIHLGGVGGGGKAVVHLPNQ